MLYMTTHNDESQEDQLQPIARVDIAPADAIEQAANFGELASTVMAAGAGLAHPIASAVLGVIGYAIGSFGAERKMQRIISFVNEVQERVTQIDSQISADYVRSDEFAELTEQVLEEVASERNEEKRQLYAAFLADVTASPSAQPYDERIKFIRVLSELQGDHLRILKAYMQPPNYSTNVVVGSIRQTLEERLPGMRTKHIEELVRELGDMRILDSGGIGTMMTGRGAQELQNRITPLGQRFTKYLSE